MSVGAFDEVADDPRAVPHPGSKELPTYLEVVSVVDLSARLKGAKTFVEDASRELEKFYQDVGQHRSKWVHQAPKVRQQKEPETVLPR